MMVFRNLEAEEIEVRVQQVTEKGCSLLLYKDARCDARILDEQIGPESWQCEFYECKGTLFCKVGILVDRGEQFHEWVWKDDAGAPSNMEAQKGEASDAFKRACFKWGIGRELYTAPFIWVGKETLEKHFNDKGRWVCRDKFFVKAVNIEEGHITAVEIVNQRGRTAYKLGTPTTKFDTVRKLKAEAIRLGATNKEIDGWVAKTFGGKAKKDLNTSQIAYLEGHLRQLIDEKSEKHG